MRALGHSPRAAAVLLACSRVVFFLFYSLSLTEIEAFRLERDWKREP